jgi:hypothetical protein
MRETQLLIEKTRKVNYSYGPYNKFDENEQWIRITEGCPWHHEYCYEPQEIKVFEIPEIVRNCVKILDMNLLCKQQALSIIKELGNKKVNNKVVYYELICGIDFRFLTEEIAKALKESRFINIRLAWDGQFNDQLKIKDAIDKLIKVGYNSKDIMVFMICNWKIKYSTNCDKLDLLKIWGVQVHDAYYDNQLPPNVVPIYWTDNEIKTFRYKSRKHNQLVNFKIDPEAIEVINP